MCCVLDMEKHGNIKAIESNNFLQILRSFIK